jgi:hypothetical protein
MNAPARILAASSVLSIGTARTGDDPAATLEALAVAGVLARAGVDSLAPGEVPSVAPADPRPSCSPTAAGLLRRAARCTSTALAAEILERIRRRGERVPIAVAILLQDRTLDTEHERLLLATADRGLASALESLGIASAPSEDTTELTARWKASERFDAAMRRAAMADLIRRDRGLARSLIDSSWDEEAAKMRADLVTLLLVGAERDDEPLLERALDDRAASVRSAAASVLATIEESAFAARAWERASPLIQVERVRSGLLRQEKTTMHVELPAAWDPAWARDGMIEKPPPDLATGIGPRSWWLTQLVRNASLRRWEAHLAMTPAEMLAAIAENDHAPQVESAWIQAAVSTADPRWAETVVTRELAQAHPSAALVKRFVEASAGAARDALVLRALEATSLDWNERLPLIPFLAAPWTAPISARVLASIERGAMGSVYAQLACTFALVDRCAAALHRTHRAAFEELLEPRVVSRSRPDVRELFSVREAIDQELPA